MTAVDTNILFYTKDPRDPVKQATAASLVENIVDGVLLWQVACEFIAAARKLESLGYMQSEAWHDIHELRVLWSLALPGWDCLDRAEKLVGSYSLSHWDSLLIAASPEAGVTRLYSEDFSSYSRIDGLEVVNPFVS